MRRTVRALIAEIDPLDAIEAEHRADALAWIDSDVEVFRLAKPATPPKHLVSYCLLVDCDTEQILLVDHRDAQRWLPTGGHIEPGEHPAAAAGRELTEELGIEPNFLPGLGRAPLFITVTETAGLSERHTDVSLWFVFEGSVDQTLSPDEREFAGVRWWPFDRIGQEADTAFDPHLARFVQKLRRRLAPTAGVG